MTQVHNVQGMKICGMLKCCDNDISWQCWVMQRANPGYLFCGTVIPGSGHLGIGCTT